MTRQLLVFDLDGTLVDSLPGIAAALNAALGDLGAPPLPLPAIRTLIGDGSPALAARALAACGLPAERRQALLAGYLARYEADPTALSRPFPGVPEILRQLTEAGCRLALCTNKSQRAAEAMLCGFGLRGCFAAILGGDALPVHKPDPAHLRAAIAALGGSPGEAAMIGDNEHDAAMANAAGVPAILVRYGYARVPLAEIKAAAFIDRFADLPAALAGLGGAG